MRIFVKLRIARELALEDCEFPGLQHCFWPSPADYFPRFPDCGLGLV
jgi:hypothetical protein